MLAQMPVLSAEHATNNNYFKCTLFESYKIGKKNHLCVSLTSLKVLFLTGAKRHIGKLLPCSRVVPEVAVRLELHPLLPGVVQTVVDSRGDADLVASRDGVSRRSL